MRGLLALIACVAFAVGCTEANDGDDAAPVAPPTDQPNDDTTPVDTSPANQDERPGEAPAEGAPSSPADVDPALVDEAIEQAVGLLANGQGVLENLCPDILDLAFIGSGSALEGYREDQIQYAAFWGVDFEVSDDVVFGAGCVIDGEDIPGGTERTENGAEIPLMRPEVSIAFSAAPPGSDRMLLAQYEDAVGRPADPRPLSDWATSTASRGWRRICEASNSVIGFHQPPGASVLPGTFVLPSGELVPFYGNVFWVRLATEAAEPGEGAWVGLNFTVHSRFVDDLEHDVPAVAFQVANLLLALAQPELAGLYFPTDEGGLVAPMALFDVCSDDDPNYGAAVDPDARLEGEEAVGA